MRNLFALGLLSCFFLHPVNASTEVVSISTQVKAAPSEGKISVEFKVVPNSGYVVNMDKTQMPPWKLEVKEPRKINFEKTKWERSDFIPEVPGFRIEGTTSKGSKDAGFDYEAVVFVCTANKSSCLRKVLKGKVEI